MNIAILSVLLISVIICCVWGLDEYPEEQPSQISAEAKKNQDITWRETYDNIMKSTMFIKGFLICSVNLGCLYTG